MTAELGRQPWLVYGLLRTAEGSSPTVHPGTVLFTLIGFCGLYTVLGVLFLFLIAREIATGRRRVGREATMPEIWYAIAVFMLTAYVVLDGFDFGAGALHLFVARTDAERRQVLAAIGPFWDGNEVWLLAAGGALFVGFPRVLASGISGFYFAIFLVLWCLILRGIVDRVPQPRPATRSGAPPGTSSSGCASTLLPVFFGAALGNLLRGVPLTADGWFELALFTDFSAREPVGILDWYTVLVGVFALAALAAHGAVFLELEDGRPGAGAEPARGAAPLRRGRRPLAGRHARHAARQRGLPLLARLAPARLAARGGGARGPRGRLRGPRTRARARGVPGLLRVPRRASRSRRRRASSRRCCARPAARRSR